MDPLAHSPSAATYAPVGIPSAGNVPKAGLAQGLALGAARPGSAQEAVGGTGPMQGLQLCVGTSGATPQSMALNRLPLAVQTALEGVKLPARPQPLPPTAALYVPRSGGLATNPAVLAKLEAHALAAGTNLNREKIREEIAGYVALGEHAVHALQQPATALARRQGETAVVHTVNPPVVLSPNMETARGISWYVAACAAQQDVNQQATGSAVVVNGQEVTNLTVKGAFVFKDPGNAIYNFLQSSPLAYSRISTHFHERSASEGRIGSRPEQRGIEDYDRRLPGQNGAMLFDKLKGAPGKEEMFLKIESKGFPDVFGSSKRVDDQGMGRGTRWQALKRWLGHGINYVKSLLPESQNADRKEHVHKGLLETSVHKPFMQVVKTAENLGLATGARPSAHEKLAKKMGLPYLERTLADLKKTIGALPELSSQHLDLLNRLVQAQAAILTAKAELGAQSDHLGIERQGAETHVDLKPHLEAAHKDLVTLSPDMRSPLGLLEPYDPAGSIMGEHTIPAGVNFTAVKDWNRTGIAVNFTVYPGQGRPGNVSSHQAGKSSTLELGCNAFVQACGNNPVAAEWISRFAHQGLAVPMLQYLQKESLGTAGADVLVSSGMLTFSIDTLPNGSVDVTMNYRYQNSAEDPKPLLIAGEIRDMNDQASLSASVTLRFDNPSTYTSTQVPVPVISAPLTYNTSHFSPA